MGIFFIIEDRGLLSLSFQSKNTFSRKNRGLPNLCPAPKTIVAKPKPIRVTYGRVQTEIINDYKVSFLRMVTEKRAAEVPTTIFQHFLKLLALIC